MAIWIAYRFAMKLSEAIAGYWLANRQRLSRNTQRNYGYVLGRLERAFGGCELTDITPADIRRHLEDVEHSRRLSKRSLSDTWVVLSGFWTWAARELKTPHVLREIPRPRYDQEPIIPLTLDDVQALLNAAEWGAPWKTGPARSCRCSNSMPDILNQLLNELSSMPAAMFCSISLSLPVVPPERFAMFGTASLSAGIDAG